MQKLPNFTKITSKRLRELRLQNGYTQKQIAELLGIRQQSYIRYEYGTSEPAIKSLVKLSELYGVSSDYILGITDY